MKFAETVELLFLLYDNLITSTLFANFTPLSLHSRFETVNINLVSKPTWYFEKNPNGTVPAYEKDGQVLYESGVLCDFFEQVYGTGELYPKDPYQKAKAKILMESATKVHYQIFEYCFD